MGNNKEGGGQSARLERSIYTNVGFGSLIFLGVGITIKLLTKDLSEPWKFWTDLAAFFFGEAGIAGIIALILIFTIEEFSKKRHEQAANDLIESINTDLFHALYKRYVPGEVFAEVEKCLLTSRVYRTEYEIDYNLNRISDADAKKYEISPADQASHLSAEIYTSFKLRNTTCRDEDHELEMQIELPIDEQLQGLTKVEAVEIGDITLDAEEIESRDLTNKTEAHLIFKEKVPLPANGEVRIAMRSKTLKRKLDMEVWSSRIPSSGMTLRVSSPADIQIHATANHSEELKSAENGGTNKIWKLEHGMFPYQSVIFWWKAD